MRLSGSQPRAAPAHLSKGGCRLGSEGLDSGGLDSRGLDSGGLDSGGLDSRGLDSQGPDSQGPGSEGLDSGGLDSGVLDSRGLDSEGPEGTLPRRWPMMAQVVLRHPIHTPVRYQEQFEARGLEACRLDHALYALPGPTTVDLGRAGAAGPPPGAASAELSPPEGPAAGLPPSTPAAEPPPPAGPARFQVLLDAVQFLPEDILIQTCEGWLLVRARHGARMDEHGFVSRAFTRQYRLPRGLGARDLRAALGHDGILVVEARQGAGAGAP